MSEQSNQPRLAALEKRRRRLLIILLYVQLVMSIVFIFYGLVRERQAEESVEVTQQAERMVIVARIQSDSLRAELGKCLKEKSSSK